MMYVCFVVCVLLNMCYMCSMLMLFFFALVHVFHFFHFCTALGGITYYYYERIDKRLVRKHSRFKNHVRSVVFPLLDLNIGFYTKFHPYSQMRSRILLSSEVMHVFIPFFAYRCPCMSLHSLLQLLISLYIRWTTLSQKAHAATHKYVHAQVVHIRTATAVYKCP